MYVERERCPMRCGDEVEVSWDDEGFRGAWYEATVVRTMPRTRRCSVIYDHLLADDGNSPRRPLQETADFSRVRPRPPRCGGPFALHQPVDAWHNDGWWTGVVAAVEGGEKGKRYRVCFPSPREQMEFAAGELRAHLDWVGADDAWVHPDENSPGPKALAFPVGTQVEVISRTRDSLSMWSVATVKKHIWENNLMVQYESMQVDVREQFLREIVYVQHVRPCPSPNLDVKKFYILDEVEVFHHGGWCAGGIMRIHDGSKYGVKSKHWEGEMDFYRPELRLRHEWINGCWIQASWAKYVKSPKLHQPKLVGHSQRSHTRNDTCKFNGSDYVSISSDNQDIATSSDAGMAKGSACEGQIGLLLSCKNPTKMDTAEDDMLLVDNFSMGSAAKCTAHVQEEFVIATPALGDGGKLLIVCVLLAQQPAFKKQSKRMITQKLNFDGMIPTNTSLEKVNVELFLSANFQGLLVQQSSVDICELPVGSGENGMQVGEKFEHHCRGQNYHSSVSIENMDIYHQLKWKQKRARSPRMNSPPQKRKAVNCCRKHKWKIRHNVIEMCQHTIEKRTTTGGPAEAEVLDTVPSLEGQLFRDALDFCQDNAQLAEREGGGPSQGNILLLQLDPVVEDDPARGVSAASAVLDMKVTPDTRVNEISDACVQLTEATGVKKVKAVNTPPGDCKSHRFVGENTDGTTVIPCSLPPKFNLPVVEDDPSRGELALPELLDMTVTPDSSVTEISDVIQPNETVRAKKVKAVNTALGCCEPPLAGVDTEVTKSVMLCSLPSKFKLPFVKSSSMWQAIEAMEVFRATPQQPHFQPLYQYCCKLREGMAIGLMVTFENLVTNISQLRITDPEDIFEEILEMASLLEAHGFEVQCLRRRLKKLLKIKHDLRQHEDMRSALQPLILERRNEGQKLTDEIEMIDGFVGQLEKAMTNLCDMKSAFVMQRETNDYEIAKLQTDEQAAAQASLIAEDEFDSTRAAAW